MDPVERSAAQRIACEARRRDMALKTLQHRPEESQLVDEETLASQCQTTPAVDPLVCAPLRLTLLHYY